MQVFSKYSKNIKSRDINNFETKEVYLVHTHIIKCRKQIRGGKKEELEENV